jgi:hypothetical protein
MTSAITTTDILFKKFLGTANALPGTSYAGEAAGSARPKVIASLQVMNQTIPAIAPTDLTTDNTFVATKGAVTRQVSTGYSYIVKYTATLQDAVTAGTAYRYDNPTAAAGNLNLLTNAIPFNFDAATNSYAVTMSTTTGPNSIPPSDNTYPWVFDTDAGYVYFTKKKFPDGNNNFPILTFWRYEGTFGAGGGGGGVGSSLLQQF